MDISPRHVQNFWCKVNKKGEDECWEWQGARVGKMGYGYITIAGKQWAAHKLSWSIDNGREPHPSMDTCHSCDNPRCVNPRHLAECTRQQNVRETALRGRMHNQKLSPNDVRTIRRTPGKIKDIAANYSINPATVSKIKSGVIWGWLE